MKKLSIRYLGPFEILERIGKATYRLAPSTELSGLHDEFHISVDEANTSIWAIRERLLIAHDRQAKY